MTNKTMLDRVLAAYRPLYLHGLLLDGRCRLPQDQDGTPARDARRQRMLLAALTGLRHVLLPARNQR